MTIQMCELTDVIACAPPGSWYAISRDELQVSAIPAAISRADYEARQQEFEDKSILCYWYVIKTSSETQHLTALALFVDAVMLLRVMTVGRHLRNLTL